MSKETAQQILLLLDEIKPLVAKLVPLLHDLEDINPDDDVALDRMNISYRAYNCLKEAGARTVGEVRAMSDHELLRLPNFGRKSLKEVRAAIQNHQWEEL